MGEQNDVDHDIASLQLLIDGPDAGLADHLAENPHLRSANDARVDLAGIIEGLEDVRAGRVVSHAQVVADIEERRRRYRTQAAE